MNQPFKDRKIVLLVAVIIILIVAEGFFAMWTESTYDMNIWFMTGQWMKQGMNIYVPDNHLGYPPLWALWCAIAYAAYGALGNSGEAWRLIIKLPMILAQFALAYVVWRFAEKRFPTKTAFKVMVFTLTCSFFIYIGVLWGQINILSALCTFLAFYAVTTKRVAAGGVLLGVAIALKIYPIVTLPVFLIYVFKNQDSRQAAKFAIYSILVPVGVTLAIFAAYGWDIMPFLRTIFYWAPVFQANPLQFQGGCMNVWSFAGLMGLDISRQAILRFLWIPILAAASIYLYARQKMSEADLNLALIAFYLLFMISYAWISEQSFLDPMPFILLQILAFQPKKAYLWALAGLQTLVYAFTTFNGGTLIFQPLLAKFNPAAIPPVENLSVVNANLFWNIRGSLGLVISVASLLFLLILLKPTWIKSGEAKQTETPAAPNVVRG